jgi:GDP-L-fucose synthase
VLPALLRKIHAAKLAGEKRVSIWGSGKPRREFLYSDDMAAACVHVMRLPEEAFNRLVAPAQAPLINIGAGKDITIGELAALIRDVVGYRGDFSYDASRPDGTPQKLLDISRIGALGWKPEITLRKGVELAYRDFQQRFAAVT